MADNTAAEDLEEGPLSDDGGADTDANPEAQNKEDSGNDASRNTFL